MEFQNIGRPNLFIKHRKPAPPRSQAENRQKKQDLLAFVPTVRTPHLVPGPIVQREQAMIWPHIGLARFS